MNQWTPRHYLTTLIVHASFILLGTLLASPVLAMTLRALLWWRNESTLTDLDLGQALVSGFGFVVVLALAIMVVLQFLLQQALLAGLLYRSDKGPIGLCRYFGPRVLLLSLRVLLPLAAVVAVTLGGVVLIGLGLLRGHDINYYLFTWSHPFPLALSLVLGVLSAGIVVGTFSVVRSFPALHLLVVEDLGVSEALSRAKTSLKGRAWALAIRMLAYVVVILLSSFVLAVVGRFILVMLGRNLTDSLVAVLVLMSFATLAQLLTQVAVGWLLTIGWFRLAIRSVYRDQLPPLAERPTGFFRFSGSVLAGGLVVVFTVLGLLSWWTVQGLKVPGPVEVIAHRGASWDAPENTHAAILRAIDFESDAIEIDIQETADGRIVLMHDRDYMKVSREPLLVRKATEADRLRLDVGSWFDSVYAEERTPLFDDVLERCGGEAHWYVELKYYGQEEALEARALELIKAHGLSDQVTIISLKPKAIRTIKALDPTIKTGLLLSVVVGNWQDLPGDMLAINAGFCTRRAIDAIEKGGKKVAAWTVNDAPTMLSLCARGVDGLITDRPDVAREIVDDFQDLPPQMVRLIQLADLFGLLPMVF